MPVLPIKFFLDENITSSVARVFKEAGYEIFSIHSLKLFGLSNGEVIEKANDYRAIIVSLDKEFLAPDKKSSFGMLIIDIHPARDPFIVPVVTKFLEDLARNPINWAGKKWKLDESGIKEVFI